MCACLRGFLLESKSMHVRIITPRCQCVRGGLVCFCHSGCCDPEVSRFLDGQFQKPWAVNSRASFQELLSASVPV